MRLLVFPHSVKSNLGMRLLPLYTESFPSMPAMMKFYAAKTLFSIEASLII